MKYIKHPLKKMVFAVKVVGMEFPGYGRATLILEPVAGSGQDRFDSKNVLDDEELPVIKINE